MGVGLADHPQIAPVQGAKHCAGRSRGKRAHVRPAARQEALSDALDGAPRRCLVFQHGAAYELPLIPGEPFVADLDGCLAPFLADVEDTRDTVSIA